MFPVLRPVEVVAEAGHGGHEAVDALWTDSYILCALCSVANTTRLVSLVGEANERGIAATLT